MARVSADLASLARNCPVVEAAVGLSEWLGDDGRRVTAGGSLRPADVPDAARALGVQVTAKVRRAADVPEVHRQWIAAAGMGLIVIDGTRAKRSKTLDDPLQAWWAGLQAVLAEEVTSRLDTDPRIIALATLTVVSAGAGGDGVGVPQARRRDHA